MTQTQPVANSFSTRSRTVTWTPPAEVDVAALSKLDGLGQLEAMVNGQAPPPPILSTIDVSGFQPQHGRVVVEMLAQEFHYNPLGTVHGGVLSTLLDTAAGCAVHSVLGVGELYTSLDLTVKFLRPVTVESGLLTCVGTVIQRGRRIALAQAELTDASGRLVAHATSSCMIFA